MAILAAILIPSIANYITSAENARDEANARAVYTEAALEISTNDTYTYPSTCTVESGDSVTDIADFECTVGGVLYTPDSFSAS